MPSWEKAIWTPPLQIEGGSTIRILVQVKVKLRLDNRWKFRASVHTEVQRIM